MKKIYQTPQTECYKVTLQQMIAASGDPVVKTTDSDANEELEVLSRRRNAWDNEMDEEEDF